MDITVERGKKMLSFGITTCEVKSGYGLTLEDELKILRSIHSAKEIKETPTFVPTCLAAHVKPPEFKTHEDYLNYILENLLPKIKEEKLADRIDIYIEKEAFSAEIVKPYLKTAKEMGFQIVVHADQFNVGGSHIAAEVGALSADHLEVSSSDELSLLRDEGVVATVLPGASLGLGIPFAPARKILDKGLSLVIASDWNPGTAPMGDLLVEAAILGAYEKLSMAETLAALTIRAANALKLDDRGALKEGNRADMCAFACEDFREILYHQGSLKPTYVWKKGKLIFS
jgi:imidazolonepropionase